MKLFFFLRNLLSLMHFWKKTRMNCFNKILEEFKKKSVERRQLIRNLWGELQRNFWKISWNIPRRLLDESLGKYSQNLQENSSDRFEEFLKDFFAETSEETLAKFYRYHLETVAGIFEEALRNFFKYLWRSP